MIELKTPDDYIKAKLCHSIHTSERRSFRGCRRRWSWIFREFFYPTATAKPLEFGVAFHKAMEVYYDPETWFDLVSAAATAIIVFKKTVLEQKAKFVETHHELAQEAEEDYNERVELGIGMLKNYFKNISPIEDRNLTPYKVEVTFEVFIKDPDGRIVWCRCDVCWDRYIKWIRMYRPDWDIDEHASEGNQQTWKGLPVTYGGRIDCLMKDNYGRYWVFDWKTARALTTPDKDDYLLLDDQITSYCWALWTLGVDIAGFIYAEIKKSFPQEPEPLKNRYKGRLYSTNKQQTYDYETYLTTIKENDQLAYEAGAYDDFLEYLQGPENRFGQRHEVERSDKELELAGYNIWLEAMDMIDPKLRVYPSPGRFSCGFCAFQGPCISKNRGEDERYELETAFDKRKYHYWETTPASTESKGGE